MEALIINDQVRIPADAMTFTAVRAGGPGGQNVNKVASKVEIRVSLSLIEGLEPPALERLRQRVSNQLDAEGRWMVISTRTRDQARNIEDAREKILAILLKTLEPPKPRHATRPTRSSQRRRLDTKKRDGDKKKQRAGGWD